MQSAHQNPAARSSFSSLSEKCSQVNPRSVSLAGGRLGGAQFTRAHCTITLPSGRTYGFLMELKEVIPDMNASTTGKTTVGSDQTPKRFGLGPGVRVRYPESMPPDSKVMDIFGHNWVRGKSRRFSFNARLGEHCYRRETRFSKGQLFHGICQGHKATHFIPSWRRWKVWRLHYDSQGPRSDNDSVRQAFLGSLPRPPRTLNHYSAARAVSSPKIVMVTKISCTSRVRLFSSCCYGSV